MLLLVGTVNYIWYDKSCWVADGDQYFKEQATKIMFIHKGFDPDKYPDQAAINVQKTFTKSVVSMGDEMAEYNSWILQWRRAYKNRFWNPCFIKPNHDLFDMRDYIKEDAL